MKGLNETRIWLGKWEAMLLSTLPRPKARGLIYYAEKFFDYFPKKTAPKYFLRSDVEDLRVEWAEQKVGVTTITNACRAARAFFNWLMREQGYSELLVNPAGRRQFRL